MPMFIVCVIAAAESALALLLLRSMYTSLSASFLAVSIVNSCAGFLCFFLAIKGHNEVKKHITDQPLLLIPLKV